jgi:hypothetical protein
LDGELRKLFRQSIPRFHWTAVETWPVSVGVPDANYCADGIEGWVEMKKIRGWKIPWKEPYLQVAWIERRTRSGGRVFLAVRREQDLYLFWGRDVRQLLEEGIRGPQPAGHWSGGPAKWDWAEIERLLMVYKTP